MLHEPTIVYSGIIRVPPQENASAKVSGDPPSCGNLMVGYASGLGGRENNQNPMFIGEVLSNNARESNECAAMQYFGTGSDICRQDSKRHCGELQFVHLHFMMLPQLLWVLRLVLCILITLVLGRIGRY
ncbi:uncharacterized protein LOC120206338 [Hibiscus syriacus]|uniref:uncharacterized protein LOC120206338 n=1 Tax=Hibiscus syriacus TaxID=106335 RepID=UPI001921C66C|nr:uncharacterized protein LOC120206338 [Hibiscus syriacus]